MELLALAPGSGDRGKVSLLRSFDPASESAQRRRPRSLLRRRAGLRPGPRHLRGELPGTCSITSSPATSWAEDRRRARSAARRLGEILGSPVAGCRGVAGGDIGESSFVELAGGERLFVKCYPGAAPRAWRAPRPGASAGSPRREPCAPLRCAPTARRRTGCPPFWPSSGSRRRSPAPTTTSSSAAGSPPSTGPAPTASASPRTTSSGRLPQSNRRHESWASLLRRGAPGCPAQHGEEVGRLPGRVGRGPRIADRGAPLTLRPGGATGASPRRSLGRQRPGGPGAGRPCLIDPAVYGGHREVDLAMMRLFGGFSAAGLRGLRRGLAPGSGPPRAGRPLPALSPARAREPVRGELRGLAGAEHVSRGARGARR